MTVAAKLFEQFDGRSGQGSCPAAKRCQRSRIGQFRRPERTNQVGLALRHIKRLRQPTNNARVGNQTLEVTHIAYKGAAPAIQDVVGGQVPLMVVDTGAGMPMIKAGKPKVLAMFSKSRPALLPDVPTLIELGLTDIEAIAWQGLVVPAATPSQIIGKLSTEMQKAVSTPGVRARLLELGLEAVPSDPAGMAKRWQEGASFRPKLIRERNISFD